MVTQRETLRTLCKSIITRLENRKAIVFPPRLRTVVSDEVFQLIGPCIMTEQDLREKALAKMGARAEALEDAGFTESDQFKTAKAMVKTSFGDDVLNGFYFLKSVKHVSEVICDYLMRSSHIDDVFESDEELARQVVETVQTFNPNNIH